MTIEEHLRELLLVTQHSPVNAVFASLVAIVSILLLAIFIPRCISFNRVRRGLSTVPTAPGSNWLLGHVIQLATCSSGVGAIAAWDLMEKWLSQVDGDIVKFRILGTFGVVVKGPAALKRIFQVGVVPGLWDRKPFPVAQVNRKTLTLSTAHRIVIIPLTVSRVYPPACACLTTEFPLGNSRQAGCVSDIVRTSSHAQPVLVSQS